MAFKHVIGHEKQIQYLQNALKNGRLAHAYVVYEVRLRPEDEQPLQKGVDSLQLVRSEGRWWIASIANDIETPDNMIPERFYENKPGERD